MVSPAGDAALARDALRSCPLFAGLDDATLMLCADAMRGRRFRRGEVLFHVEDPGDALFVVTAGEVKIVLPIRTPPADRCSSRGRYHLGRRSDR